MSGRDHSRRDNPNDPSKEPALSLSEQQSESMTNEEEQGLVTPQLAREKFREEGKEILKQIPSRMAEVYKLLELKEFLGSKLEDLMQKFPQASQEDSNESISKMSEELRPLIVQMLNDVSVIRLLVTSEVAEIDVEKAGPEIEEKVITMATGMLGMFDAVDRLLMKEFNSWTAYHLTRSNLLTNLAASPREDGIKAIYALDCNMILQLRSSGKRLLELYVSIDHMMKDAENRFHTLDSARKSRAAGVYKNMYT